MTSKGIHLRRQANSLYQLDLPGHFRGEIRIGGKPRHKLTKTAAALKRAERKIPVAVLVSRDGEARARAVEKVSAKELDAFVCGNTDVANSRLLTDELLIYRTIGKKFGKGHKAVNHLNREYARGDAHNNSCESFNSLLKRAYHGAWHHISREHVARYLSEQTVRWTNRKTSDWERTQKALGQMNGVRLYYKQPRRRDQQDGDSLVASA